MPGEVKDRRLRSLEISIVLKWAGRSMTTQAPLSKSVLMGTNILHFS